MYIYVRRTDKTETAMDLNWMDHFGNYRGSDLNRELEIN